ncbi:GNAT family N-acetyltransferase [Flexibacterium corallicola]|uniref:GNAT family N-acetyltransferase n=1 Tax=Flexibacterium corallicola TaxID=3037259 RepID=UPI00286F2163|nr:GNAT family N-acetyltransferase [Pseudovibrio sp. M1P-2-3]
MRARKAVEADAAEISVFLVELTALGKRRLPSDEEYVRSHYILHTDKIQCTVVEDIDGSLLGLQILKMASENNPYDVTPGWGMIGTHVNPKAGRQGVGKLLFSATIEAARNAGLQKIDATIGASNLEGLGYYEAMGFRSYKTSKDVISKCLELN